MALSFLGGAFTLREKGHAKIDLIYAQFSKGVQKKLDLLTSVCTLVFLSWLGWLTFKAAMHSLSIHEFSDQELWPLFPVKILIPVGILLVIIQVIVNMKHDYSSLRGH